jgi:hypothetical protein
VKCFLQVLADSDRERWIAGLLIWFSDVGGQPVYYIEMQLTFRSKQHARAKQSCQRVGTDDHSVRGRLSPFIPITPHAK